MRKLVVIGLLYGISMICHAQVNLVKYQYWFDNYCDDTTTVDFSPSSSFLIDSLISTNGLVPGAHALHFRIQDEFGVWSSTNSTFFVIPETKPVQSDIANYEYWVDGNYAGRETASISGNISYILDTLLDMHALLPGAHALHFRIQDEQGIWSSVNSVFFVIPETKPVQSDIANYEYWVDGNYTGRETASISGNISYILDTLLDMHALLPGAHALHFRVQDELGIWSSTSSGFFIVNERIISNNVVTAYQYWFGQEIQNMMNVPVTTAINTYQMVDSMILVTAIQKANSSDYEFLPDVINGHKVVYKNRLPVNMMFKDLYDSWSSVQIDTFTNLTPTNVTCEQLYNEEAVTKILPVIDTIHFYCMKVFTGDTIELQLDKTLIVDIFNPEGNLIETIQDEEALNLNKIEATMDGLYYILVLL